MRHIGTGFYRSNDPTDSVKACEGSSSPKDRLQSQQVHLTMLQYYTCMQYTLSEKRPTLTTCYNFYIHSSIATIFGTNVANKVGKQNLLYFPTIPN